jgi:TIR domain-containing protein
MAKIFISYRREELKGVAGRLYDQLQHNFGEGGVFLDVERIHGGEWLQRIKDEAGSCEVMVVLIGQNWQRPHLGDKDYVRMECRIGLEKKALMIPTIIDDARIPKKDELPADIAPIVDYQAVEIRNTRFKDDARRLIEVIETKVPPKKTSSSWSEVLGGVLSAFVEGQKQRTAVPNSPTEMPATFSLARTIPGQWQLEIIYPNGTAGYATVIFEPGGNFRAQGRGLANFRIDGTWRADSSDQMSLRGRQFDGVQTLPYHAVVGFSDISANAMVGALNTGERTVWQRMR